MEIGMVTTRRDIMNSMETGMQEHIRKDILFIQQMLAELRNVARANDAEMLMFLIEMAFAEAEDILTGKSPLKVRRV